MSIECARAARVSVVATRRAGSLYCALVAFTACTNDCSSFVRCTPAASASVASAVPAPSGALEGVVAAGVVPGEGPPDATLGELVVPGPTWTVPVDPDDVFPPPPIWTVPVESVAVLPPLPPPIVVGEVTSVGPAG